LLLGTLGISATTRGGKVDASSTTTLSGWGEARTR